MAERRQEKDERGDEPDRLRKRIEELEQERGRMRETLKDSEERLRLIYENSPLGMGFISVDGVLTDCNDAFLQLMGADRDKLVGLPVKSGINDEAVAVALGRAFAGTIGAFEGDYPATTGGRTMLLRTLFAPLFSRDGGLKGVLFIAEDISERKRMEESLRDSESRYKAIVESQAEFVVRYLAGGIITYVNDTLCRYVGLTRDDLLGASYYPFMHPEDREAFVRQIEALDRDHPSLIAEARVVLPDGRVTWHRWTHHAILDGSGRIVEYQATGRDVTELKEAEDRLRESEERYRQLYEAESDAIFLIDNESGRILLANSAAASLYGYGVGELLAMENTALSAEPAETRRVTAESPVAKDHVVTIPLRYHRRKDGTVFPVEITGRFFHLGGRSVHISAIRDITGRRRAEEAVRRQAELLDLTHDAIFVRDENERISFWNRGAEMCYGWSAAEALGRVPHELLRTQSPVPVGEILQEVREKGFWDGVLTHFTKDGRRLVVMSRWSLRRAEGETPFGILELNVDITEQRRVEAALRDSEEKYKFLIEATRTGFVILDTAGRVLDANDEYVRLSGYGAQADIHGRNVVEWTAAHDRERNAAEVKKCMERGFVRSLEIDYVHPDGRVVPVEIGATVMGAGEGARIYSLCRDISQRKQAETALRESEEKFSRIFQKAPLLITLSDLATGKFIEVNEKFLEISGFERDEVIDRTVLELGWITETQRLLVMERLREQGRVSGMELTLRRKNGKNVICLYNGEKITVGGSVRLLSIAQDITELRLLEDERLKTQKLESIGTLAGGIAHDFNNLLQGIFGYIAMARMNIDHKEKTFAALEQAEKALHLAVNLTGQLLTFSKGGKPVKKRLELGPVIEKAVRFALSGSRLDHRLRIDAALLQVEADEGQISQVIQNIVMNADQAMPQGGTIEIDAKNVNENTPGIPARLGAGQFTAISIRDSGTGIRGEHLSRIFDPYFTTKETGSGLGLATCYSIVTNHGGAIDVQSRVGEGSLFTVYLPAASVGEPTAHVQPGQRPATGRRGRILVMDDEEIVRTVAGDLIRTLGHDVAFAENGAQAIDRYREAQAAGAPFDIVILDLTVRGGMGGDEAMQRLLAIDPDVKAVVSSGYSDDNIIAEYRMHGFQSFLKKPYELEDLDRLLNTLLA